MAQSERAEDILTAYRELAAKLIGQWDVIEDWQS